MPPIFRTTCLECGEIFGLPQTGDFSYGDQYFGCECGKAFAYHNGLSHPVSLILELLCDIFHVEAEGVFDFSAYFADKITGHRLKSKHVCPNCKSENLSFSSEKIQNVMWDIPTASYNRLYSLDHNTLLKEFEEYLKIRKMRKK